MTLFKSPLIWRLTLWFLLLSLIPIGIVLVFVQRQVRGVAVDQQIQQVSDQARLLAHQIGHQPEQGQELINDFGTDTETAFLLDAEGIYVVHPDSTKVGSSASIDIDTNILKNLLSAAPAGMEDSVHNQFVGAAKTDDNKSVAVVT